MEKKIRNNYVKAMTLHCKGGKMKDRREKRRNRSSWKKDLLKSG